MDTGKYKTAKAQAGAKRKNVWKGKGAIAGRNKKKMLMAGVRARYLSWDHCYASLALEIVEEALTVLKIELPLEEMPIKEEQVTSDYEGDLDCFSSDGEEKSLAEMVEGAATVLNIELPMEEMPIKEEQVTSDDEGDLDCFSSDEEEKSEGDGKEKKAADPDWVPWKTANAATLQTEDSSELSSSEEESDPDTDDSSPKKVKKSILMYSERLPCDICQDVFNLYHDMLAHTFSCHPGQDDDKCGICRYKWTVVNPQVRVHEVTRHMREAHDLDDFVDPDTTKGDHYVCKHCTFMCRSPMLFVFHLEDHHEAKAFSCVKCGYRYKAVHRYQIYRHLESEHEWNMDSPIGNSIFTVLKRKRIRRNGYDPDRVECKLCGETVGQKLISAHINSVHEVEKQRNEFKCRGCSKTYKLYKQLNRHSHKCTHMGFACSACGVKCGDKYILRIHIERCHLGVKHAYCQQCDLFMFQKEDGQRHISDVHEGLREYLCATCGKGFKKNAALKVHVRIHTDEKPLKCEFCDYSCRQRNALNWHMKKHKDKVTLNDQEALQADSKQMIRRIGRPRRRGKEARNGKKDGKS